MAQRKETKTKIKVRDLKPKKDAKGGGPRQQQSSSHQFSGLSHQQTGSNQGK